MDVAVLALAGCATALATIEVYEEERLIERAVRMGERMKVHHEQLA